MVTKITNVLIVESDLYARNWEEMLLRRDWRTRVVQQVGSPADLAQALADLCQHREKVDLVLIGADLPCDEHWLDEVLEILDACPSPEDASRPAQKKYAPPAFLLLSTRPAFQASRFFERVNFVGYILKDEIRHALAWAVTLAANGQLVITPGVGRLLAPDQLVPGRTLVLDGRTTVAAFSQHDAEAARLSFMFSMERSELADELGISEEYSYGLVSSLYEKMGLNDILSGEASAEQYFGDHPAVQVHLRKAIDTLRKVNAQANKAKSKTVKLKKVREKESLAFHLLTLPEIEEIH